MTTQAGQESFTFQAEVVQILDLMIHSLYSNKEIFLRELISNASDAIDRLRFEAFANPEGPAIPDKPQIRVGYDTGARTITVSDNGVGMSRAEVMEHIGTIAKSGTHEFLQALSGDQRKDATLIGQFGVGFYSAFVVADRVTLTTLRAGRPASEAVRWESDGRGAYTLEQADKADHGTEIVLHLRDGEDELLNGYRLRSIITKYSDHISVPILMPAESAAADAGDAAADAASEAPVNRASALWARPKSEITERDYHEFYQHIAGDVADPLGYLHSKIEGTYEYTLLLFVPSRAPFDLWMHEARRGVRLHVRRVFIMQDAGQLMPMYLRFIRGVIDSGDLPLNVSRELLQSSRVVDSIRSSSVKKVLKLLTDLAADEPEKYAAFWREFGAVLKEGIAEDYANRDEIAGLLRFRSTESSSEEPDVSLSDYVARMKPGQEKIYYMLAPTAASAASSPHLEVFRKKGVEVLLLSEAIDNWVVASLQDFDGKRLQSVAQGAPDLGALEDQEEQDAQEKAATEFAPLLARLKEVLAGQVWDVRVSSRLTESPACIVANEPEIDINLARRLRGSGLPRQPVLEVNPRHPLVDRLNRVADDAELADWAQVLYSESVLTLGAQLDDPTAFVGALNGLLMTVAEVRQPDQGPANDPTG
jgi:molecular chaperone HtpG